MDLGFAKFLQSCCFFYQIYKEWTDNTYIIAFTDNENEFTLTTNYIENKRHWYTVDI